MLLFLEHVTEYVTHYVIVYQALMIVFQVSLNFDPVKKILKMRYHFHILMKKVVILRRKLVKMKSFAQPLTTIERNYTYSRLRCRFITSSIRIGNLDWCKCQKRPLEVFCEKRCSLKFRKIHRKHLLLRKHLSTFVKFLRKPFLQNNTGRLLLKCGHCKNEAREIDCLCCREVDAMLIASAKIPE